MGVKGPLFCTPPALSNCNSQNHCYNLKAALPSNPPTMIFVDTPESTLFVDFWVRLILPVIIGGSLLFLSSIAVLAS